MSQNRSSAVMAQRVEPHDSLDDFPTPPWAVRAMLEQVFGDYGAEHLTCWEPAANRGYMVRPLQERFRAVFGSDVHDYGAGFGVRDLVRGQYDPKASSATSYAWFVWRRTPTTGKQTIVRWIPPGTRARLEREEDYAQ